MSYVDRHKLLSAEDVALHEASMDQYAVLVYCGQNIADEQQADRTINPLRNAEKSSLNSRRTRWSIGSS